MEITENEIENLLSYINQKDDFQDERVTKLAELTAGLAAQVRLSAEREISQLETLQTLFSEYATMMSGFSGRARSEIIEELNSKIAQSAPQTHLKVV